MSASWQRSLAQPWLLFIRQHFQAGFPSVSHPPKVKLTGGVQLFLPGDAAGVARP
jgi:hypothetical protein